MVRGKRWVRCSGCLELRELATPAPAPIRAPASGPGAITRATPPAAILLAACRVESRRDETMELHTSDLLPYTPPPQRTTGMRSAYGWTRFELPDPPDETVDVVLPAPGQRR